VDQPAPPDGYLYLHCAPTSTVVKCGSTKDILQNNQRYLIQNDVMDMMYFPVYLGPNEHLSNYELAFHERCALYKHAGKRSCSIQQPPIIQKLKTNDLTRLIEWARVERKREGRHELYLRENGDHDMVEFYQEVLLDVISGNVEIAHSPQKKK